MVSVVREGDVLVTHEPVPAIGMTHWRAPFTGGFDCVVPAGTALVARDPVEGAEGIGFRQLPLRGDGTRLGARGISACREVRRLLARQSCEPTSRPG
jgi:hypothetical protein